LLPELPSLAVFELELPEIAVPVVSAFWLSDPPTPEEFPACVDGLLNVVLLLALAVSFLLPSEAAKSPEPAEADEPWLA
jgi:hypothetical protein